VPCPYCGQMADQRYLHQVIWHESPGHEPLDPEPKQRPSNSLVGNEKPAGRSQRAASFS